MIPYKVSGVGSFSLDADVAQNYNDEQLDAVLRKVASRPELHYQFGFIPEVRDDSFGSAFKYGIAKAAQNLGTTVDLFDEDDGGVLDRFSNYLKNFDTPDDYKPAFDTLKEPEPDDASLFGVGIGSLPRAIVEQVPQFIGSLASRGVGAGAGALAGGAFGSAPGAAAGALFGGIALPLVFEAAQILGPIAYERARNNGRAEPNEDDLKAAGATALASGAINTFALNGLLKMGTGPALRFVKGASTEGVTETAQGIIEQVGGTLGTEKGLDVNLRDAALEGLIGAGIGGPVAVVANEAKRPKPDFDEDADEESDKEGQIDEDAPTEPIIGKSDGVDPKQETALTGDVVGGNILNNASELLPQTTYETQERTGVFYTSQKGDTLGKLAKKYNVSVPSITEENRGFFKELQGYSDAREIPEGTRIKLPNNTSGKADVENVITGYQVVALADPDVEGSQNLPVSSFFGTREESQKATDLINSAMSDVRISQEDSILSKEIEAELRKINKSLPKNNQLEIDNKDNIDLVRQVSSPVPDFTLTEITQALPDDAKKIQEKVGKETVTIEEAVGVVGKKRKGLVADTLLTIKNPNLKVDPISKNRIEQSLIGKNVFIAKDSIDQGIQPDVNYKTFLKRTTGIDNIDQMSNVQKTVVANAIENIPTFSTPMSLPLIKRPSYTSKQLSEIVRGVRATKNQKLSKNIVNRVLGSRVGSASFSNIKRNLVVRNIIDPENNRIKDIADYVEPFRIGRTTPFEKRVAETEKLTKPTYSPEYEAKRDTFYKALKQKLTDRGLGSSVNLEIKPNGDIEFKGKKKGQTVEGAYYPKGEKHIIQLALDLDANQDENQQIEDLAGVLDHETFHVFYNLAKSGTGPLLRSDFRILDRVIAGAVKPDRVNGDSYNNKTYFEVAKETYSKAGLSKAKIKEEAYAELFRDWARGVRNYKTKDGKKIAQPRTIFQRIWDYFFGVKAALIEADLNNANKVFERINKPPVDAQGNPIQYAKNQGLSSIGSEFDRLGGKQTAQEGDRIVSYSLTQPTEEEQVDIAFEVAPDPKNIELVEEWSTLNPDQQRRVSNSVVKIMMPKIKRLFGANAETFEQIGSYEDKTNTSFALRVQNQQKGDVLDIAKSLGFALNQDSMFVVSNKRLKGTDEGDMTTLTVGDMNQDQVDALYKTIRNSPELKIQNFSFEQMQPVYGDWYTRKNYDKQIEINDSVVQGQSTLDGEMMIINQSPLTAEEFSNRIANSIDGAYRGTLKYTTAYNKLVFREDSDGYQDYESEGNDPDGDQKDFRVGSRNARSVASSVLAETIQQEKQGITEHGNEINLESDQVMASLVNKPTTRKLMPVPKERLMDQIRPLYQAYLDAEGNFEEQSRIEEQLGTLYLGQYKDPAYVFTKGSKGLSNLFNNLNTSSTTITSNVGRVVNDPSLVAEETNEQGIFQGKVSPDLIINMDAFYNENLALTQSEVKELGRQNFNKDAGLYKTNLIKRKPNDIKWEWLQRPDGYETPLIEKTNIDNKPIQVEMDQELVTIEGKKITLPDGTKSGSHLYALNADFPTGSKLSTYATLPARKKKPTDATKLKYQESPAEEGLTGVAFDEDVFSQDQPSLRPSVFGTVKVGNVVGKIITNPKSKNKKEHNVYDTITITASRPKDKVTPFVTLEEALPQAEIETNNQIKNLNENWNPTTKSFISPRDKMSEVIEKDISRYRSEVNKGEEPPVMASLRETAIKFGVNPDLKKYKSPPETMASLRSNGIQTSNPDLTESEQATLNKVSMSGKQNKSVGRTILDGLQSITSKDGFNSLIRTARVEAANQYANLEEVDDYRRKIGIEVRAGTSAMAAAVDSDRSKIFQASMWFDGGKPEYNSDGRGGFRVVSEQDGGGKSLVKIFQPIGTKFREFQLYLAAIRARRLIGEGRERLLNEEDIQNGLRMGEKYPEFEQVRQEYLEWNRNFLNNVALTSGTLSQNEINTWLENSDYVSFVREGDESKIPFGTSVNFPKLTIDGIINEDEISPEKQKQLREVPELLGTGQTYRIFVNNKIVSDQRPISTKDLANNIRKEYQELNPDADVTVRVTGRPLGNFLENLIQNIDTIVSSSMKNVALQRTLAIMELQGTAERKTKMQPGYSSCRVRGKTRYYSVYDQDMAQALSMLTTETRPLAQGVGYWLTQPTYILREAVTRMPNFIIKSLNRDSFAAWQTSGRNIQPVISGWQGFGEAINPTASKSARAVRGAMGFGGYDFRGSYENMSKVVQKSMEKQQRGPVGNFFTRPISQLWDWSGHASNAADAAVRIKVYQKTLAETGDWVQASYEGRQVIDYARRGANQNVLRWFTATLPFINARIQGIDLMRVGLGSTDTGRPDSKKTLLAFWARGMAITSFVSVLWMLQHDDEDWKNQPPQIRDMNYILTPKTMGLPEDVKPFKFPISFELGTIFKVLPERILQYVFDQESSLDLKQSLVRNAQSSFGLNIVPQVIRPLYEIQNNYNMFTGQPIESPYVKGKLPPLRVKSSTSEFAKILGEQLNLSPIKIDHLIQGYAGPLGATATLSLNTILQKFTGSPLSPTRELERSISNPLAREVFLPSEPTGTLYQFYELKQAIDQVSNSIKDLSENFGKELPITKEQEKLYQYKEYADSVDAELKKLRQIETQVRNSNMSQDQKRDEIRYINIQRNSLTYLLPEIRKEIYG